MIRAVNDITYPEASCCPKICFICQKKKLYCRNDILLYNIANFTLVCIKYFFFFLCAAHIHNVFNIATRCKFINDASQLDNRTPAKQTQNNNNYWNESSDKTKTSLAVFLFRLDVPVSLFMGVRACILIYICEIQDMMHGTQHKIYYNSFFGWENFR